MAIISRASVARFHIDLARFRSFILPRVGVAALA